MKKRLQKIIFYLMAILFFFTPVLFTTATNELYEFPKMIFVYLVGTTIVFLFLVKKIWFGEKFRKPDLAVVGYVVVTCMSVLFSTHIYTSVWGYYSRFNGGLVSFLVFFGIYYVCLDSLNKKKYEQLISFGLLSVIPIGMYGLSQLAEVKRIYSTFGQPNWFAAYLVFVTPLILQRIINTKVLFEKFLWGLALALSLICLWLTGSISGILGIVVGLIYVVLNFGKKLLTGRALWGVAAFILVIIIAGISNFGFIRQRFSDALVFSEDPSSYSVSDPGLIRYGLWSGTLRMAVSSFKVFMVGIGPETFPYEFPLFRPDILNYSSEWDFIMNKPHNYYLELLVESGIFAFGAYLVIIYKVLRSKNKYLAGAFMGLFVTHLFGWPSVFTELLFWVGLAGISFSADYF